MTFDATITQVELMRRRSRKNEDSEALKFVDDGDIDKQAVKLPD